MRDIAYLLAKQACLSFLIGKSDLIVKKDSIRSNPATDKDGTQSYIKIARPSFCRFDYEHGVTTSWVLVTDCLVCCGYYSLGTSSAVGCHASLDTGMSAQPAVGTTPSATQQPNSMWDAMRASTPGMGVQQAGAPQANDRSSVIQTAGPFDQYGADAKMGRRPPAKPSEKSNPAAADRVAAQPRYNPSGATSQGTYSPPASANGPVLNPNLIKPESVPMIHAKLDHLRRSKLKHLRQLTTNCQHAAH